MAWPASLCRASHRVNLCRDMSGPSFLGAGTFAAMLTMAVATAQADEAPSWTEVMRALDHEDGGERRRAVKQILASDHVPDDVGRALVAGPHVVGSPAAIRADAVVVALGRAAPSLIPGGAAAAGPAPVEVGPPAASGEDLRRDLRDELREELRRELRAEAETARPPDEDGAWSLLLRPFRAIGRGFAGILGNMVNVGAAALLG